ncbi:hypothetical protein HMN09_00592400 [Mycena chlorophos]|uniref:Uncharacterized protein n=1 Tax=Mycena chlorophos TaxID=658473 RepID=A0A8H6W9A3_MYCCL|nr:hypothetical protein HMN09_00592400 [Mycena chlorophos]
MKFSTVLVSSAILAASVSARPQKFTRRQTVASLAASQQSKATVTAACKADSDCQQGCCGFSTGLCAGPAVAQQADGGCGFGTKTPNCDVATLLGFTADCVSGFVNDDLTDPTIQAAAAFAAQLDNLPFTPSVTSAASTTAAAAASTSVAATDNSASSGSGADLQSSTTLDPSVIQNVDDGQNPPTAGQTAAVVSQNNFINFCAQTLPATPLTNGLQLTTGSCNPTPIGLIPSSDKMPSGKFQNPTNGATIPANQAFTITLAVKNIQLGDFTNAQQTYFANPQTLNADGIIVGHTHFVIEAMPSLNSTAVTDPTEFIFFKGVDDAQDADGNVSVNVTAGVPAGAYRLGTIVAASTHQPAIVPIAQHGLLDDVIYFTAA